MSLRQPASGACVVTYDSAQAAVTPQHFRVRAESHMFLAASHDDKRPVPVVRWALLVSSGTTKAQTRVPVLIFQCPSRTVALGLHGAAGAFHICDKTVGAMATDVSRTDSLDDEKVRYDDIDLIHGDFKTLDVGLTLVVDQSDDTPLQAKDAKRLRRKIDWHLLPLLCMIYTAQFIDKSTIASSSILGLIADNHLTTSEFNTLSSAFYIGKAHVQSPADSGLHLAGYLLFVWPQNWALQRLPVGKWLTFNILLWSVFLGLHPLCHSFGGLYSFLGASEGSMTAGLMLVCSMFYTRLELIERLGWAVLCNGFAVIFTGFIQFGMAHTSPHRHPSQWQWMMITTALMTFVIFVLFLLFFPDNPTNAWFLSPLERRMAVRRVRDNQNGIETKAWKRYQMIEAFREPRTWIYFVYGGFSNLIGGVGIQYSLIIKSFGFTLLQTTLLGIPSGAAQVLAIVTACYLARRYPHARGWISVLSWVPSITACILEICAPFENRTAHLVGIYLIFTGGSPSGIITMSWISSNTSGHTKKLTTTAIYLVGYSLGQTLCSQFWLDKYKPKNHVPFGIILMSHLASILCTVALWYSFVRENKRRDALRAEALQTGIGLAAHEQTAIVDTIDVEGKGIRKRVDKMYLDLTDSENLAFRYIL
ncbi:hypothetical protein NM688_g3211 [Phlebia brevispora]|uniref:Uncharacterized protein n=1 Tax=Phlebia brevispora TaxID=194682 RepID=A0ACC1T668_9APHY|nr:hypothetical protein NM688_g3211 [Phlebia brevispora]